MMNPPLTFLYVRSYLLQEETRMDRTHKMEAATALLATGSNTIAGTTTKSPSSLSHAPPSFFPSKSGNDRKKKRKQSAGRGRNNSTPPAPAGATEPWAPAYNPWTGVVQA
jgi:hypothetical protein